MPRGTCGALCFALLWRPAHGLSSALSVLPKAAPSQAVWNPAIKKDWSAAYASVDASTLGEYDVEHVEGTIPPALRGTVWRNGPGNFERGGERYAHVLDGDGLLCRFSIDGPSQRARFAARLVNTPQFEAEDAADTILYRNTFGTQPRGKVRNAFDLTLKNPANTNVQCWGGKTLALWEAALPCRIDPASLAYEAPETFDGLLPDGALTVTSGLGEDVDRILGLGVAFTAHPREDPKRKRMVGWSWAAPLAGENLAVSISEWDSQSGAVLHTTKTTLPSRVAPHDFAITESWYVYVLNAMELQLAPYVLGLTGPVGALSTSGEGVTLKLIPRPDGRHAGREPLTIATEDPYFAIHHACAFEEVVEGTEGATPDGGVETLRLLTAAWPVVGQGPFLGDWGGAVPYYDDGKINPTLLLQSEIHIAANGMRAEVERTVAVPNCIDHPHVDPRFEGDARMRYVYMSYCNDEGVSGSPPVGWARWDRRTGDMCIWRAPPRTFCEEVVVIPRPRAADAIPSSDEADVWIAAMLFDADSGRSALAIIDGDNIEAGPVCRLWCRGGIPHGLHGCFTNELVGM
jgi:all-trans-8'-apo-beta-carotenal 15,15'-oxygenase